MHIINLAAQIAGFSSIRLINNSTAVAISYRNDIHLAKSLPLNVGILSIGAQTTEVKLNFILIQTLEQNLKILNN